MWKNQLNYFLFMVLVLLALILTGKPFLLCILLVSLMAALFSVLLTVSDAKKITMQIRAGENSREGGEATFLLDVSTEHRIKAASGILVEMEIYNVMFDTTEQRKLLLCLRDRKNHFTVKVPASRCGELRVVCTGAWVLDRLKLLRFPIDHFHRAGMVVYPHSVKLQVQLSPISVGSPREDGFIQNRKGNDLSETYDIREYIPGDDIRAIHWKLSSKTGQLILRQPSEPFHYNVVILPDLGLEKGGVSVPEEEINTAVAAGVAMGEQLIRQGCAFCMAIPTMQGIELYEVRNEKEFMDVIPRWLGNTLLKNSGIGLDYFLTEHLQHYFTRVVILSAGQYEQDLKGLDQRVSVLIVNAVEREKSIAYTKTNTNCEMVEIPTKQQDEVYRIVC